MRSRQAGVTFIGWIVLLIPIAIVGFAGIKLFPLYMNQLKVSKALEQVAATRHGDNFSPQLVRVELEKHFDIDSVDQPALEDVVVERQGDQWVMVADYDATTSLFGNISLVVHFNKRVVVE
jgi:hypothetical protein